METFKVSTDGTDCSVIESQAFSFCRQCTVADRCCTKLGPDFDLPAPIVTEAEARRIRLHLGGKPRDFVTAWARSATIGHIQTNADGRCVFHHDGRCTIYDARPFDCQVFPLDILRIGERYYWVAFTEFCQQPMHLETMLVYGESLLARKDSGFLQDFAWNVSEHPCKLLYLVLKEIQPPSLTPDFANKTYRPLDAP